MSGERTYWFEAKTYGIGWMMPASWQGWAVVFAFLMLLLVGIATIDERLFRIAYIVICALGFSVVVAWKGEKPFKWRWGRD